MDKSFLVVHEHRLRNRVKGLELQKDAIVDLRSDDLEIKTVIDDLENAIFRLRKAANTLGDMQDE